MKISIALSLAVIAALILLGAESSTWSQEDCSDYCEDYCSERLSDYQSEVESCLAAASDLDEAKGCSDR
jgi:hypothetical protein